MTVHPVARPVFALEPGESMSKMVRVCRALKVLHGPGITWHQVGDYTVFFTPGDMCGCAGCIERIRNVTDAPHADPLADYIADPVGQALVQSILNRKEAKP